MKPKDFFPLMKKCRTLNEHIFHPWLFMEKIGPLCITLSLDSPVFLLDIFCTNWILGQLSHMFFAQKEGVRLKWSTFHFFPHHSRNYRYCARLTLFFTILSSPVAASDNDGNIHQKKRWWRENLYKKIGETPSIHFYFNDSL